MILLPTTGNGGILSERCFASKSAVTWTEKPTCNGKVGAQGDGRLDSEISRI